VLVFHYIQYMPAVLLRILQRPVDQPVCDLDNKIAVRPTVPE